LIARVIDPQLTSNRVRLTVLLLRSFWTIYSHQRLPGLIKTMKSMYVLTIQSLGGYKINDVGPLGPRISRTKSGLPRVFPVSVRKLLKSGDPSTLRWVLSILSLSRALEYLTQPNLSTITSPFTGSTVRMNKWIQLIPQGMINLGVVDISLSFPKVDFKLMYSSSASSNGSMGEYSSSPTALLRGLKALGNHPICFQAYKRIAAVFSATDRYLSIAAAAYWCASRYFTDDSISNRIGKLGLKQEPQGKVRIFAMVDPWTQMILAPIHKWIFRFLSRLPMDGTMNQLKPLGLYPGKGTWIASYDLSAATDRLPIAFQKKVMEVLFSDTVAQAWVDLLVGRTYELTRSFNGKPYNLHLKYAVGQPMGALSSWAMLALTHHIIVQIAAIKSGYKTRFTAYAILGDDMVVWDKDVAAMYLTIMKDLGLEINLSKSIVSPNGIAFEFAKRVFINGQDVSPISLTEYAAAINSVSSLFSFVRKYSIPKHVVSRLLGLGYRNTWKSIRWRWYQFYQLIPTDFNSWLHEIHLIYGSSDPKAVPSVPLKDLKAFLLGELLSLYKRFKTLRVDLETGILMDRWVHSKIFSGPRPSKGLETLKTSNEFTKGLFGPLNYYSFLYELFKNFGVPALRTAKSEAAAIAPWINALKGKGMMSKMFRSEVVDRFNLSAASMALLDAHKIMHNLPVNFLYQRSVVRKPNKPLNVYQMMVKMFNTYRFLGKFNRDIKLK